MRAVLASVPVKCVYRVKGLKWLTDLCWCSLHSGSFFQRFGLRESVQYLLEADSMFLG